MASAKLNAVFVLFDQQQSYHLLPPEILAKMPGYQAFKTIGVDFTHMQCNRSACSSARAVIQSGIVNTGIQDVTNMSIQYDSIPYLPEEFDTNGKVFKRNGYKTAFYGKSHLDSRLCCLTFATPSFSQNTSGAGKAYGYDVFNTWGESDFYPNGMLMDCFYLENIMPPYSESYDYIDKISGNKLQGLLPYLRARAEDKSPFMIEYHLINPHDIESCVINLDTVYNGGVDLAQPMFQFFFPFMREQTTEYSTPNPYVYNSQFTDAYIHHKNMATNYFEKTYEQYKTDPSSIPNVESLITDYALDSTNNMVTPFLAAFNQYWWYIFNTCGNKDDFAVWKNLINTYYGLVLEADSYVIKLYNELKTLDLLKNTNVIISSDHGEMLSAHGQRSKAQIFNESLNVPCLVYSPNLPAHVRNTTSDFLCSAIDIIPTFIDLCNLTDSNREFIGTSLFENYTPKSNYTGRSAFYVFNSNAFLPMYYSYLTWYNSIDSTQQANVYRNPSNLFEFQYCVACVTTFYNNKTYKFARYFSLTNLMKYNFKDEFISKSDMISTCDKVSNSTGLTDMYNNIKSFLIANLPESFTYSDGADAIISKAGNNDNIYVYGYAAFAIEILSSNVPYKVAPYTGLLKIPGSENSYSELVSADELTFACYDLTDDPKELTNLADPKNIKPSYTKLFTDLNNVLNVSIIDNGCSKLITILPFPTINNTITSLINSVYNNLVDNLSYDLLKKLTYATTQQSNEAFGYKIPKVYNASSSNQFYNITSQPNVYPATGDYNSTTTTISTARFVSNDLSSSSTSSSSATASGSNMDTAIINSASTSQAYAMNYALKQLKTGTSGQITVTNTNISTVQ